MFEILLLIGLFTAGISQLLPDGTLPPAPKKQDRTRAGGRRSKTNYDGANQRIRKNAPNKHAMLQSRPHFTQVRAVNVSIHRETG